MGGEGGGISIREAGWVLEATLRPACTWGYHLQKGLQEGTEGRGGEGSSTGPREKLGCGAVSVSILAKPQGAMRLGCPLRLVLSWGAAAGPLYPLSYQLQVGHSGEHVGPHARQLSTEGTLGAC